MKQRGGGRGGRGGGKGGGTNNSTGPRTSVHVAKPLVDKLPDSLYITPSNGTVPSPICDALPEFRNIQSYFSALERLCPEYGGSTNAYKNTWLGISGENIVRVERIGDSGFEAAIHLVNGVVQPIFIKRIHLLDAASAMEGDYVWPIDGALPAPSELWKRALSKINDPLNEAYVDTLFACAAHNMVTSSISPHWCKSFGTFTARVEKYRYNISDEYYSMKKEPWWNRNQKLGLFTLCETDEDDNENKINGESFHTTGLSELNDDDFDTLDIPDTNIVLDKPVQHRKASVEDTPHIDIDTTQPVQLTAPKLRLKRMSPNTADSDDDSDDDDESCEGDDIFVEFRDFPVQVTLLEHAEGTIDELIDDEHEDSETLQPTKEARWTSWLFQVIAGLTVAQYMFGFVHNDLHSNNVMWSGTSQTHLYYRICKASKVVGFMKVPTYGRIMKIIDFGRASFHLPDPAGFFISDAFYPGNDAATQYNCEPFYDSDDGKKVEPNTSFDLCRLAVSLVESLYDERPAAKTPVKIMSKEGSKLYTETVSPVYNMLWDWLQDDNGQNVLRKPNGDERYPDFELYRVLASSVHKAIPSKQIERPIFEGFRCNEKDIPPDTTVFDLFI